MPEKGVVNLDRQEIGKNGEDRVCAILADIARKHGGVLLRNLYIPKGRGTVEIDALLLTRQGIFVTEIKNINARKVVGSVRLNEWTAHLGKRGGKPVRWKFYNPIKQNKTHLETVARITRIPPSDFTSLIVFASRTELKVPENTKDYTVVKESMLRSAVLRRLRARRNVFSTPELEALCRTLKRFEGASHTRKRAHIARARQAERKRLAEREKRRKAAKRRKRGKSMLSLFGFLG